jgi:hypothetical protein
VGPSTSAIYFRVPGFARQKSDRRVNDHGRPLRVCVGCDRTSLAQPQGRIVIYVDRRQIILEHKFDPMTDLKRNSFGVLELVGNKPALRLATQLPVYRTEARCLRPLSHLSFRAKYP